MAEGKFSFLDFNRKIRNLFELREDLKICKRFGIGGEQGKRTGVLDYLDPLKEKFPEFKRHAKIHYKDGEEDLVPLEDCETILEFSQDFNSTIELKDYLNSLNLDETIDFVDAVLHRINPEKWVDCSKALIFVLGNIDEAFTFSGNLSPDTHANVFHQLSQKISIYDIKKALQKRFRDEQIARLGNIHVIYPALPEQAYYQIIDQQLAKINRKVIGETGIGLDFQPGLKNAIYREGVYPTQGTRPLFSTIHQMIKGKLGDIFKPVWEYQYYPDTISLDFKRDHLTASFLQGGMCKDTLNLPMKLHLDGLRAKNSGEKRSIVAVHESGHVIVAWVLYRTLPLFVQTATVDGHHGGFVHFDWEHHFSNANRVIAQAAFLMGGRMAESMVFGREQVTGGATADIEQATAFILSALKEQGLGHQLGRFQYPSALTNYQFHDPEGLLNEEGQNILAKALEVAREVLQWQHSLLKTLANHLFNDKELDRDRLAGIMQEHGAEPDAFWGSIEPPYRYSYEEVFRDWLMG